MNEEFEKMFVSSAESFYITPSKPLMSSGSWLTLNYCQYCEFSYLSAVYYGLATTNFIMVKIHPWPWGGWLTDKFITHFIYQGHYLPCGLAP
jgi:hypothetical protein